MRVPLLTILVSLFITSFTSSALAVANYSAKGELTKIVWECPLNGFENEDYSVAVSKLIEVYEKQAEVELKPGERKRVGLKIYTNSGPGLATPKSLVRAVAAALEARGFDRKDVFLVDRKQSDLKNAGYLPSSSKMPQVFEGMPVYALDSGEYYDKAWFYSNNLPSREKLVQSIRNAKLSFEADPDERKSFLPAPLILEAEFWINLPMVCDSAALAVNGALSNVTLWNISNNKRFFGNPANASVAVAEIAGIPELKRGWVFTLMTLQKYQYMNGPNFNSLYTKSEPRLWLSANPIALDALMFNKLNRARAAEKFPKFKAPPAYFEYTSAVGYGPANTRELKLLRVPNPVSTDS